MEFSNRFLSRFFGGQLIISSKIDDSEVQGEILSATFETGILNVEFLWMARRGRVRNIWREEKPVPFVAMMLVLGELPAKGVVCIEGEGKIFTFIPTGSLHILKRREVIPMNNSDLEALAKELEDLPLEELDFRLRGVSLKEEAIFDVYCAEYRRRKVMLPP